MPAGIGEASSAVGCGAVRRRGNEDYGVDTDSSTARAYAWLVEQRGAACGTAEGTLATHPVYPLSCCVYARGSIAFSGASVPMRVYMCVHTAQLQQMDALGPLVTLGIGRYIRTPF